jgi:hypothetical protein
MMLLMGCVLTLPEELATLLRSRRVGSSERESAIRDFLNEESHQFDEFLDAYRTLTRGLIVGGSLSVDEVELNGKKGIASMSFFEQSQGGCRDLIEEETHSQTILFHLSASMDEIILEFYDPHEVSAEEL